MFERFYNQALRKITVGFGTLFNNVYMTRMNLDGTKDSEMRVPLAYGPKTKWIRKLNERTAGAQMELPRMSFDIVGIEYDPSRKKNSLQRRMAVSNDGQTIFSNYMEVPYNIEFELSVMVQYVEDGLSILEQILPYFSPDFTISIDFNETNQNVDIPISLNSTSMLSDYEGALGGMRIITMDLSFTAKANMYGPQSSGGGRIQKAVINFNEPDTFVFDDYGVVIGCSGPEGELSEVHVGVTGPSGASSGPEDFTDYTVGITVYESGGTNDYEPPSGITIGAIDLSEVLAGITNHVSIEIEGDYESVDWEFSGSGEDITLGTLELGGVFAGVTNHVSFDIEGDYEGVSWDWEGITA
jgi:hypothetical protein